MSYDLHFHSAASDGAADLATIRRVIAARPALRWVCLADHDTLDASVRLAALEPRALVGLETVASSGNGVAEFLAINVWPDHPRLRAYLEARRAERTTRFAAWGAALRRLGFRFEPPAALLADPMLTKSHAFAELRRHPENLALLAKMKIGPAGTNPKGQYRDPAGKLFYRGGPAHIDDQVPSAVLSPERLIALIHAAGGLAVLAHPYWNPLAQFGSGLEAGKALIRGWARAGLDGMEVFHRDQTDAGLQAQLLALAAQCGLLIGIGCDDHTAGLGSLGGMIDARDPRLPAWEAAWERALARRRP